MRPRMNISGFKELQENLAKLRVATGRAALRRGGMKALEPMARAARLNAPHDTYELIESISVGARATDYDYGAKAYAAVMKAGGSAEEALEAKIDKLREIKGERGETYVDLYMGPHAGRTRDETIKGFAQEFGTEAHAAHPYMRPAFDQEAQATINRAAEEMGAEIAKALARSAKRGTPRE